MGFNNSESLKSIVKNLKIIPLDIIIGEILVKIEITKNEEAVKDYILCFEALFAYVDYFVVNVSSPNTPGLRDLQDKEPLTNLLNTLQKINLSMQKRKPILLKIAPDLTNEQLDDIVEIVKFTKIDGVVATNTTINRDGLIENQNKLNSIGNGGLSGKYKERSNEVIKYLSVKSNNSFPIIGVGGIHSANDALEKIKCGATLVQLYARFCI